MVTRGVVFGHIVSEKGIKVDKAKIDLILKLSYTTSQRDIKSFSKTCMFLLQVSKGFLEDSITAFSVAAERCPI